MNRKRALIIIPAYNEAGVIGKVVREIKNTPCSIDHDILVINDGSVDDTAREAREAGARTITLVQNLGYGYALQTGYRVALEENYQFVLQMDGDGQHAPESIPLLMDPLIAGECDLTIGSRALSNVPYPMPLARRIGQTVFAWILYHMGGLRIQDPTSGFQGITPKALRLFVTDDFPGDYPDTNVLLYLALHGVRVKEVPAVFRINDRGKSMHSGVLKPAFYIYKMMLSMMLVHLRHQHEKKQGVA